MVKSLPSRPNLEQLKKQAKELLKSHSSGDPAANERFKEHHPNWAGRPVPEIRSAQLSLSDAQLVVAREYGFPNWARLKTHVENLVLQSDPMQSLKTAVLKGDIEGVARTLERFPELRARLNEPLPDYGFGTTALLAAVERRNKELIDLLVRSGADINGRSHWWAGSFGVLDDDRGLASFLIEHGAVVDVHAAARLGMMARLKELVSAQPELVHARGGDGQTPLHFAATAEIAGYLLDHGAKIDARDIDHESTPAQYMVRDRQEVARFLIQRGCHTDILMASALGDLELVRTHLDADPECIRMTVCDRFFPKTNPKAGGHIYIWTLGMNRTPHTVAREFGHEQVLQLLLERSPAAVKLAQACELGEEALFQQLLAARPDLVQTLSDEERRKLPYAAQNNNARAVAMLLKAGWPVDTRGTHGATALHWAGFHGNAEMTRTILAYHPPLEWLDEDYEGTPLGWAIHGSEHGWHCKTGHYPATVEALIDAGANVPEIFEGTDAVKAVLESQIRKRSAPKQGSVQEHRDHRPPLPQKQLAGMEPKQILESSQRVLLVDWPSTTVPRALLEAGLTVFGCSPAQYSRAELVSNPSEAGDSRSIFPPQTEDERGYLVFRRLASRPEGVDIVAVYRPANELPGILAEQAVPLGARVLWLQRPVESEEERMLVRQKGLVLIENCDLAETAKSLRRQR